MEKVELCSTATAECRNILDVIEKDFQLTHDKHKQLSDLQDEIKELTTKRKILSKRKEFNDRCCIHCCSVFNLLHRRKLQCHDCHFWVCRSCVSWDNENKIWLCDVCEKQRLLDSESWTWFYSHLKSRFKHFGRAKILEGACRRRRTLESENDSGYGPCSDLKPVPNMLTRKSRRSLPNMADSASLDDCEDEDDDIEEEEEEAEIHHSIETIVEGLLGSTLDDASVDRVYPNFPQYEELFSTFHGQLVVAVKNLSLSLKRALHNIPHDNDVTPTAAHAALKRLISALVRECQELPYMQLSDITVSTDRISLLDVDMFSSYESLVASAIINKVVEDNQAKYFKHVDNIHHLMSHTESVKRYSETYPVYLTSAEPVADSFSEAELPLECVQVEEIEEITHEYTDSEEEKLSSISHHSSGLHSFDDQPVSNVGSGANLSYDEKTVADWKIPFPEFGQDLVEDLKMSDDYVTCYPSTVTSWEENWLFRKKKRAAIGSNLKYQLMTYCDDPPCMLIPFSSETHCTVDSDELSSELSETHSVGSLEFSSDSENQSSEAGSVQTEQLCLKAEHNSITVSDRQSITVPNLVTERKLPEEQKIHNSLLVQYPEQNFCSTGKHIQTDTLDIKVDNKSAQEECKHLQPMSGRAPSPLPNSSEVCELASSFAEEHIISQSPANEEKCNSTKRKLDKDVEPAEGIFHIPTQPGTIAEREHNKWLNAVPLKNNPYSAENISKRYNNLHTKPVLKHVSSFEEFEKHLKDFSQSATVEPTQTKLDCGLKSIDTSLYKRDYYINNLQGNAQKKWGEQFKSWPCFESINSESCESIPEETLNSLEEKVYISAGKVFTLENHVKRLERELKDTGPSTDMLPSQYFSQKGLNSDMSGTSHNLRYSSDHDENLIMPSVKSLATKFNSPDCQTEHVAEKSTEITEESAKIKKPRPCMKVHSLTARSLSREFRDRAKQNIPKPMNRIVTVPVQNETTHGYTSDESSTSSSSLPRLKTRRHISRSILQRASYWERRAEQSLLSDASVSEEFPAAITFSET